jgi:hypothetical protein
MPTDQEKAAKYQDLFNMMAKEHNLILTIAEMDEIILEAQKVVNSDCLHININRNDGLDECMDCGTRNH